MKPEIRLEIEPLEERIAPSVAPGQTGNPGTSGNPGGGNNGNTGYEGQPGNQSS